MLALPETPKLTNNQILIIYFGNKANETERHQKKLAKEC